MAVRVLHIGVFILTLFCWFTLAPLFSKSFTSSMLPIKLAWNSGVEPFCTGEIE